MTVIAVFWQRPASLAKLNTVVCRWISRAPAPTVIRLGIYGAAKADLSDASITVHFSFDDMRGANFSHAHMTVIMANQSMGLLRTEFISAKLDGADFTGAGLGHVSFRFAKLKGAYLMALEPCRLCRCRLD
jgi:uncharacterized protein YjbI with pentapeptide repeats